jgi:hypothetical protein
LRHETLLVVRLGIGLLECPADGGELSLGGRERQPGLEPPLYCQVSEVARRQRIDVREADDARPHGERYECRFLHDAVQAREFFRRDTHDRELDAGDVYGPSDDRCVRREFLLPRGMTQDDDGVPSRDLVLRRQEASPEHGLDVELLEEVSAHHRHQLHVR